MPRTGIALVVALTLTAAPFPDAGRAFPGAAPASAGWIGTSPLAAQEASAPADDFLPSDGEHALAALNASPRHGEWVMVPAPGGDSVRSWVVYPERSDPAPVIVVIHEIYGLTSWVRAVADNLARHGYIAIAPDLLSGKSVPRTDDGDPERQAAVAAIRELDPDQVQRRIRAAADYAMALPSARPLYATVGFCWGGSTSFQHATRYTDDLLATVVFYGTSPDEAGLARVRVPVIGMYGGDDERVAATVPRARTALGDRFVARLFPGAGHGFMRQQSARSGANLNAVREAWPFVLGALEGLRLERGDR